MRSYMVMMRTTNLLILFLLVFATRAQHGMAQPPGGQSPEGYITQWKEVAMRKMKEHGIPASITLAQGLLESRNGNSLLAAEGNNHFGIKCTSDWSGGKMYHDDDRKNDCFRRYKRAEDSFEDHSMFLMRPRYAGLFELKPTDYKGWAHGLKKAGYATDPAYPRKLIDLIERYELSKLDEGIDVSYAERSRPASDRGKPGRKPRDGGSSNDMGTVTIGGGRDVLVSENRIKYVLAKEGETVSTIAADLEQMPGWLAGWNDMAKDQELEAGQVVYTQPKRNKSKKAEFHLAEGGETLWGISQRFGVKLQKLAKYNSVGIADPVSIGQKVWLRKPRN
jgi:LysM repeat protein